MRFLRRIAGILGFSKDEAHEARGECEDNATDAELNRVDPQLPRRGFSVPVQVAVERTHLGPVLVPCTVGDGGVQGLKWYARSLRIDEDGDVADEFLDEILPEASSGMKEQQQPRFPRFEVKYSARPAKVRNQALAPDGKVQQIVEHQGRIQWV
ncbi:hypothetical protein NMG60_11027532 [Bertholletia excelsa]